jgi:hypothetical protein
MGGCKHEAVEWQQHDEGMHAEGWVCRWCSELRVVEYHHRTGCRRDFCGADPAADDFAARLSSEEFRAEFERTFKLTLR